MDSTGCSGSRAGDGNGGKRIRNKWRRQWRGTRRSGKSGNCIQKRKRSGHDVRQLQGGDGTSRVGYVVDSRQNKHSKNMPMTLSQGSTLDMRLLS